MADFCFGQTYFGRSATSLTSAMTSLCSSSRCLRRTSFCCRGTDSGQNRHTSSSTLGPCRLGVLAPSAGCSGKHSGSSMLSWPEEDTHASKFLVCDKPDSDFIFRETWLFLRCLFCPDDFKIQITKFKTLFSIKFTVFLELGIYFVPNLSEYQNCLVLLFYLLFKYIFS